MNAIQKINDRLALRERQLQTLFDTEKLIGEGPCFDEKLDRDITIMLIKTTGLLRYRRRLLNRGEDQSRIH